MRAARFLSGVALLALTACQSTAPPVALRPEEIPQAFAQAPPRRGASRYRARLVARF